MRGVMRKKDEWREGRLEGGGDGMKGVGSGEKKANKMDGERERKKENTGESKRSGRDEREEER